MFGAKLFSKKLAFDNRDSSVYAALRGSSGDDDSSSPSEKEFDEPVFARKRFSKPLTAFNCAVILLLISTNILTFIGLLAIKHKKEGAWAEPESIPKSAGLISRSQTLEMCADTEFQHALMRFPLSGSV
jgi:hypothetical protein